MGLATKADAELLAAMGYKQELKRNMSKIEIFAISFSIIGLLPSIASTLYLSLPAGPVGLVWGWFVAGALIFMVGVAMAELGSALPTSGGLYWWTHYYSSPKYRNPLCFLVGYSNTLGLIGGICSIDYGFSVMLLSVVSLVRDGTWQASNGVIYAVFAGTVIGHGMIASTVSKMMPMLQTVFLVMNFILILVTIIALPVGAKHRRNDAAYVFTNTENGTSWPTGWAFMLAWLSPIWTIGGYDSCVHMSEEATNAVQAVPFGILMSTGSSWIFGFIIVIVIAACMSQDTEAILNSKFGQPMAQIYYDALGKHGAEGMMVLVMLVQFMMGLSLVVVTSRQAWAFSRDGAFPFSRYLRVISKRAGYIPLRMVWTCVLVSLILGLLCLINEAATSALFTLGVSGCNLAYMIPILARVVWGEAKFKPGPFYTGKFSKPIAWFAVAYLLYVMVLTFFPTGGPDPAAADMNYSVVIAMTIWGGALMYYFLFARKWFTGPKTTLEDKA
ncbi:putative GABA permease [Myriangium duriaei CBS 260.36]|uniref:GABA permease n=1 Tax=Myriangium duriaei CBS 260.36 TaxID=1168546 RepID=A0A9P4IUC1_9PEZI|nr:putative GABA permease [Myriangium duriaei CBS 260.36]